MGLQKGWFSDIEIREIFREVNREEYVQEILHYTNWKRKYKKA